MEKRIAIWGYGNFGKRIYDSVGAEAITDKNWYELRFRHKDLPIVSPMQVKTLYQAGMISGVVIAVENNSVYEEIYKEAANIGIPVVTLRNDEDYIGAAQNSRLGKRYRNYEIYSYKDVSVYTSVSRNITYIFDSTGRNYMETFNNMKPSNYWPLYRNDPLPNVDDSAVIDRCCVLSHWCTATNYAHFTFQALDKMIVLENEGYDGKYMLFSNQFARNIVSLSGVSNDRIIWVDSDSRYQVREMICAEPVEPGSLIASVDPLTDFCSIVDNAFSKNKIETQIEYPKFLFSKRIGTRKLSKKTEEIILDKGFFCFVPEDYTPLEQMQYYHNADVVIGGHGSNMVNTIYMKKGGNVIELFGSSWITVWWPAVLSRRGIDYRMLVEDTREFEVVDIWDRDFEVDLTLLSNTIDIVLAHYRSKE